MIRVPNSYNIFTAEFYKSDEGKAFTTLAERNSKAGDKWRSMSKEDKQQYVDAAKERASNLEASGDSSKEASRILRNMEKNIIWAEKCKIPVVYMVHHNNNVYHGGTKQGCKFLSENSDISRRFTLAVQTEDTHEVVNPKEKALLRIAVQNILNVKYALAVGDPKAHVPYESLQPSLVAGLPPGVEWKRPSHYGINTLKLIIENADNIYFKVGYHNQVQSNASEHVSGDHQGSSQEMQQSLTVQRPGSNNNSVGEGVPMSTRRYSFGEKLDLLYNSKVVARGDAVEGEELHGKPVPLSFQKVAVTSIIDGRVKLMLTSTFDDSPYITLGQVIAWPLLLMKKSS